jgi:hypothetical protein
VESISRSNESSNPGILGKSEIAEDQPRRRREVAAGCDLSDDERPLLDGDGEVLVDLEPLRQRFGAGEVLPKLIDLVGLDRGGFRRG